MSNSLKILRAEFQALWLPALIYIVCVGIMWVVSDQNYAAKQWQDNAKKEDGKPLYIRIQGYDADAVAHHWGALHGDQRALRSQRLFLQLDLFFPLFYGGALAVSLWRVWTVMDEKFSLTWLFAPLVLTMVADWTENLTQLSQLRRFVEVGKTGLQPEWIQIASIATTIKVLLFFVTVVLLIVLAYRNAVHKTDLLAVEKTR
jgi:hypothetical protein